jgi:cytochrome c553
MRYFRPLLFLLLISLAGFLQAAEPEQKPAPPDQSELLIDEIYARIDEARKSRQVFQEIQKTGRERAIFCAACHGDDGNSNRYTVPKLAAQNPLYLQDQFARFETGHRKSYVMQDLAKGLTDKDKVDLMIYYATASRSPGQMADMALAEKGKQLYAVCQGCHGPDGMGMPGYANIAAQHAEFVEKALTEFRDGGGRRDNIIMKGMTANLSDGDIKALAAYIESMPPKTFQVMDELAQPPATASQ